MPKAKKQHPHANLVSSIVDYLANGLKLHAYENDNPGRFRADIGLYIKGKTPGKPDILACLNDGRLVYIEAKIKPDALRKGNDGKPGQVAWFRDCKARDIPCFCAFSIDDVIKWFKDGDFAVQSFDNSTLKRIMKKTAY